MTVRIKRREKHEYVPGFPGWYVYADAACGQEVSLNENVIDVYWKDGPICRHAMCDLCDKVDHTIDEVDQSIVTNWFPVLACNSFVCETINQGCDGINHRLYPLDHEGPPYGEDCYWWYQGNYPNGWVYWQGDWRCGPCAERTIFGKRS